jgi:hypothetical protein
LRALLALLGIADQPIARSLIADARSARVRRYEAWWQAPAFGHLSDDLRRYFEYEAAATTIRSYSIRYIPGPLQLPDYAAALTEPFDREIPEDRIAAVVEARHLRRESVLSRLGSGLQFLLLVDESVLMRETGGAKLFANQLSELHRLADGGLLDLRMLPFSLDVPIANNATFDILSLGAERGNEVMYRENGVADELVEDLASIERHLARFHQLWEVASDEADTIAFVRRRIKQLGLRHPPK